MGRYQRRSLATAIQAAQRRHWLWRLPTARVHTSLAKIGGYRCVRNPFADTGEVVKARLVAGIVASFVVVGLKLTIEAKIDDQRSQVFHDLILVLAMFNFSSGEGNT